LIFETLRRFRTCLAVSLWFSIFVSPKSEAKSL
jgi:hypothetical protein